MERFEALAMVHRRFAMSEAELTNGFAEHATMGAEALLALGVDPASVLAWSNRHDPTPSPVGSPLHPVRADIRAELADEDWRTVMRRRAQPLVHQLDAHLFHGLIRTAHAVRALDAHDNSDARSELATGLAAWSLWAADQPISSDSASRHTLANPLADVIEFARRGAAAFVATPSIFTLHAVTAPMAFLLIADHVDEQAHVVAASVFANTHRAHRPPVTSERVLTVPSAAELAPLAQRWDAHPAKLVEAALRGYAGTGDAIFLDAVDAMMT